MSGSRGGSSNFGVRLSLDGAEAVESGLRRVQAAATQTGQAVTQAGESTGSALTVIERGTQVASAGLTRMGGDAAALVPILDNAGGAVGRLVTALGTGAGLVGVLGGVGALVATTITVYQNWDTVTRGVGAAYDFLTGRVRVTAVEIARSNALLVEFRRLSETGPEAQQRAAVADRVSALARAQTEEREAAAQVERLRTQFVTAQQDPGNLRRTPGFSTFVPTDQTQDALRQRAEADRERLAGELRVASARLADAREAVRLNQGAIAGLGEAAGTVINPRLDPMNDPNLPLPPEWQEAPSGGGGGGAAGRVNAALRDREALLDRNRTAAERYAEGMSRIAALNDRLIAQGNDPLPDETVQREATRLMNEYERATGDAASRTRDLAESSREFSEASKDFSDAGRGAAKAIGGALEDVIVEGKNASDVLRTLERDLLRIGTRALVTQPLERFLGSTVDAAGGALSKGGIGGLFGSLFGSGGAAEAIGTGVLKGASAAVLHTGGMVGDLSLPTRFVPASTFADAPRFHAGGMIGADERPVIAQTGERILSRRETAAYNRGGSGGVTININGVKDPNAFRSTESQLSAFAARVMGRSWRNR